MLETTINDDLFDFYHPGHKGHVKNIGLSSGIDYRANCGCGYSLVVTCMAALDFYLKTNIKQAVTDIQKNRKQAGACTSCGDVGEWRAMALICRQGHGRILG